MPEKPRRLGRGLDALIPSGIDRDERLPTAGSDLQRITLSRIRPNPYQPRRKFRPDELAELEASLKASGLIQPITVRRNGDAFELISGERRLRAATNLGWTEIQAIVRDYDERSMLVLALVENLQRLDLNAIEEARGYRRLIDEFKLTQQEVAESVGKDRTTVTNLLRMLALPESVQRLVEEGKLSAGHARALLPLPGTTSLALAADAVSGGLSVRDLERRVRELLNPQAAAPPTSAPDRTTSPGSQTHSQPSNDPAVRRIEDDLRRYLQTDVSIQMTSPTKGSLRIAFYSHDDLDRTLDLILRDRRKDF
jgi:ParB family chromosome partitioning protein